MLHRVTTLLVLAFGLMSAVEAATDKSLEVSVAQGYDTNPLELNPDVLLSPLQVSGGSYTRLDLDARLAHSWNPRVGYFVSGRGQGHLFPSRVEEADSSSGRVEAGLGLVLFSRGQTKLSAALSGSYGEDRSTFVDPATGRMYVTLADPNTLAPIPHRFDASIASAGLDLRLRTSRALLFSLDTVVERQDYTQDYEDIPTLQRLDDRSMTIRPGMRWEISDRVRLDVTAEWNDRRYDELSALEEDATLAADGARRRYRTEGLRTVLRVAPTEDLSFQVGLGGVDRQDTHAGYYDSTGVNGFAAAAWSVTPNVRLGLRVSQAEVSYQRATLDFLPNGDLRGGTLLRLAGSVERDLGGHVTMFGEAGTARSDNADPLYDYQRTWAHAGVRCKL